MRKNKKISIPTLKLRSVPYGCPLCGGYLEVVRTITSGGVEVAICRCAKCHREFRFPV